MNFKRNSVFSVSSWGKINKITLTIDRPKLTPEDEKKLMQAMREKKVRE